MRSECLYNDEKLHVSEVYHVVDGKQINIENKVELFRKLGREKKLFCPCGCGENVVLVAGPKNVRRQHFRLLGDITGHRCEYEEEGELSISAKGALKCWLENTLNVASPKIQYRVPISEISDTKRRFELTFYEPVTNAGIVYARLDSTVATEKIELIGQFRDTKVLFVAADFNEDTDGQYPEYMLRIQKVQGFCAYLLMDEDTPYEEIDMVISLYEKDYRGLWELIPVLCAPLYAYELGEDNELYCNGERILTLAEEAYEQFQADQAEELERLRIEEERRAAYLLQQKKEAEERAKREAEERARLEEIRKQKEAERRAREIERQKEIAAQKEREKEAFYEQFPKLKRVYDILSASVSIGGRFASDQSDGKVKYYRIEFDIVDCRINMDRHYVEVKGKRGSDKVFLYVVEEGYTKLTKPGSGVAYERLDCIGIDLVDIYEMMLTGMELI